MANCLYRLALRKTLASTWKGWQGLLCLLLFSIPSTLLHINLHQCISSKAAPEGSSMTTTLPISRYRRGRVSSILWCSFSNLSKHCISRGHCRICRDSWSPAVALGCAVLLSITCSVVTITSSDHRVLLIGRSSCSSADKINVSYHKQQWYQQRP